MGITVSSTSNGNFNSSNASIEGEHFHLLINPNKFRPSSASTIASPSSTTRSGSGGGSGGGSGSGSVPIESIESSSGKQTGKEVRNKRSTIISLHPKARLLQRLSAMELWKVFLDSALPSFALTPAEISSLFEEAANSAISSASSSSTAKGEQVVITEEIKDYLSLLIELSEKDTSKTVDFMAVCSSILFLSNQSIEMKIDILFAWIALNPEVNDFQFDDFLIALSSFERGLSHAMGRIACSESYVREVAMQWFALADPQHRGVMDPQARLSQIDFFEFCINRQHVVRRLLEAFSSLTIIEDRTNDLSEVIDKVQENILKKPIGAGDEWMANPAWKKTADRMIPSKVLTSYKDVKPTSNLELEWVHGYRGYDCRNNIFYADAIGQGIVYPAAGLTVLLLQGREQIYFGEHKDDVISLASLPLSSTRETLFASGEIGKQPGIFLYSWTTSGGGGGGAFQGLCCFQGFHTKGISHLVFSSDGKCLFSIGIDYTVAVYCCDRNDHKLFGKMLASSQGPKERVLHVAACVSPSDNRGGGGSDYVFYSCGEKHAIVWTFQNNKTTLKQENCKFLQENGKNQIYLCCATVMNGLHVIMSSQSGDFSSTLLSSKQVKKVTLANGNSIAHDKSAINAIWSNYGNGSGGGVGGRGEKLISGDRDGKVIIWVVSLLSGGSNNNNNSSSDMLTLTSLFSFTLTGFCRMFGGEIGVTGVPASSNTTSSATSGGVITKGSGSGKGSSSRSGKDEMGESEEGKTSSLMTPPSVRAITVSLDGKKLVVGTQTCEILEYSFASNGLTFLDPDTGSSSTSLAVKRLMAGHYQEEVWGLAVRPITEANYQEGVHYATTGDDLSLRVWDLQNHCLLAAVRLPAPARACAYSPDGLYLAVGLGGGRKLKTNSKGMKSKDVMNWDGGLKIFRIETRISTNGSNNVSTTLNIMQVADIKDAKQSISCLKYSPDGTLLAAGARDNNIYVYSVPNQYKRKFKFSKHNAGITQLDFSICGKYLQSCCSAYEILFSDMISGAQVTDGASKLMEMEWHTWTCTLGWSVIGIWSGTMDGSDVNSVDRSPSHRYLASSDDFGKVNIFLYPAIHSKGAQHTAYAGHSSHVTTVRWTSIYPTTQKTMFSVPKTDDYLISVGGEDKCIFQWKHSDPLGKDAILNKNSAGTSSSDTGSVLTDEHVVGMDDIDIALPSGGDEFMAVKPWLGAIVAPTQWTMPDPQKAPPFFAALGEYSNALRSLHESDEDGADKRGSSTKEEEYKRLQQIADNVLLKMYDSGLQDPAPPSFDDLELAWVHGYRGFDCRNNVFYVSKGENRLIVYYAAALGMVYDPATRNQKYFRGHSDDILAMAIHEVKATNQILVATGQQGMGNVYVWEVPSMQTLAVLPPAKQKTIQFLSFSIDGRLLVSLSEDLNIVIFDWKTQNVVSSTKVDGSTICALTVVGHSTSGDLTSNSVCSSLFRFFTAGDKLLRLWTLQGRNLTSTKYVISTCGGTALQLYLCVVEINGKFYVGCEDGSIYIIPIDAKGVSARFSHSNETVATKEVNGGSKAGKTSTSNKATKGSAVTAMHVHITSPSASFLLTGAKDGSIVVWNASKIDANPKPERLYSFGIDNIGLGDIMAKQIQSISMKPFQKANDTKQFLMVVGTRGCDMLEVFVDLQEGKQLARLHSTPSSSASGDVESRGIIVRGHCNDEVWGIATHPTLPEYCTVGDDKTLRFYDLLENETKVIVPLGFISRCCSYNYNGTLLAVGFGGRVGKGKEAGGGIVRIYSADWRSELHRKDSGVMKLAERKDAKQWISDIKFTPDGRTVVAGAHDCKIYIYDLFSRDEQGGKKKLPSESNGTSIQWELKLRCAFAKHNSVINHLDLSFDNRFMQSNCSAYELLFCDLSNGKQIVSASEVKDVKWASWTCTLGWPVQGIWKASMDGSDINAVARSHTGHLLALGDDFGQVQLYRYPCVDKAAKCLTFKGHSSHVMNVRWTCGDEYLLSAGGHDKCIFQWRHNLEDTSTFASLSSSMPLPTSLSSKNKKQQLSSSGYESDDSDASSTAESTYSDIGINANNNDVSAQNDLSEGPLGGDESGMVKPWLGAVRAPSNPPPISPQPPSVELNLQWVFGYSSSIGYNRPNLFYNSEGGVLFPAGALGVSLKREKDASNNVEWKQSYYRGHDDDILSFTVSADRKFLATGQIASKSLKGKASIVVWSASECRLLCKMEGCHQRGVQALSFNYDATKLVSVGMDDSFTHIVWADIGGNWSKVQQIAAAKGDKQPALFLRWVYPDHASVTKGELSFISGGSKFVSLWKVEGSSLTKKQARTAKKGASASSVSIAYLSMANLDMKGSWNVVIGTSMGDLLTLDDKELTVNVEKAHAKAIFALADSNNHGILISGGKDCFVRIWNQSLQLISSLNLQSSQSISSFDPIVLSLDIQPVGTQPLSVPGDSLNVLVGTAGGEIIEVIVPNTNSGTASAKLTSSSTIKDGNDRSNFDLTKATLQILLSSHFKGELWGLATHPLDPDIFATVGDDGTLRVWSIKRRVCLQAVTLPRAGRCLAWHPLGNIIAVGLEEDKKANMKLKKGKPATKASKKVKIAANNDDDAFAINEDDVDQGRETDGDRSDSSFDTDGGVQIYLFRPPTPSQAADLSLRAVGCFPATHPKGSFVSVSDIKFSPNGEYLYLASHDCKLRGYALPVQTSGDVFQKDSVFWDDFGRILSQSPAFIFDKHSSTITHFDCSMDGLYLQSNDLGNELLFYDLQKCRQEPSASKLVDYNSQLDDDEEHEGRLWATQTCVFGWAVQGIWPPHAYDSSEINAVDRHSVMKLLATGEDSGRVRVLRYPAVIPNSQAVILYGHASHVTNTRWTLGQHLISVGGNDKSIFVWELHEK